MLAAAPLAAQSPPEFRFVPPGSQPETDYGRPIAFEGDLVAIGANTFAGNPRNGEVFLYRRSGPNAWAFFQRLTPTGAVVDGSDRSTGFGQGLAISPDERVIVVGDPDDDELGFDSGAIYIFLRQPDGTYQQSAKLFSPFGGRDMFGRMIVYGDDGRFVVTAPRADGPSGQSFAGALFVYDEVTPGTFAFQQTVFSPEPLTVQEFGRTVAFDGTTLVVGVPSLASTAGVAFVLRERGGQWTQVARFQGENFFDDLGDQVALDGSTLAIGVPDAGPPTVPGEINIYRETAPDMWTLETTLTNPDPRAFGEGGVSFFGGCQIVIAGDRLAACGLTPVSVGAAPEGGPGFAFVYERGDDGWTLIDTIEPSNGTNEDFFSQALGFDGTTLVAGAPRSNVFGPRVGAAYAYRLDGAPPPPPPGDDLEAPALSGSIAGRQYEGVARDDRPDDTGIASLTLRDATNLQLDPDAFTPGDGVVDFAITLVSPREQGKGFVVATDGVGNEAELWVCSDGCPPPGGTPPPGMDETPPSVTGSIQRTAFQGTASDSGSGIASVALGGDAANLRLTVDAFTAGTAEVEFTVRLIDPRQPGSGSVVALDVAGNAGTLFVDSENRNRGAAVVVAASEALPAVPTLQAAFPNPFASRSRIDFAVPEAMPVRLSVFDVRGRLVAVLLASTVPAGHHSRELDAAVLPSGVYLVRFEAGAHVDTQRVVVLR